jgi:hypothetical protein
MSKFTTLGKVLLSLALLAMTGAATAANTAEAQFARMDLNRDQQLSADEFKAALSPRNRPVIYQRLSAQFRAVDIDHSGYLEAIEFSSLAMIEDAGVAAPSLSAVDTSKDARIDFKEFVALAVKLDPTKREIDTDATDEAALDATSDREGTGTKPRKRRSRAPYADGVLRLSPSRARRAA